MIKSLVRTQRKTLLLFRLSHTCPSKFISEFNALPFSKNNRTLNNPQFPSRHPQKYNYTPLEFKTKKTYFLHSYNLLLPAELVIMFYGGG